MADELDLSWIEKLTPEQKIEYLAIIREQEAIVAELERKRKEEGLYFYRPLPKQVEVHVCNKRSVWAFGGNRVGKSLLGAIKDIIFTLGARAEKYIKAWPEAYELKGQIYDTHREQYLELCKILPTPNHGWVCSESFEVQRDVVQTELLRWLPKPEIRRITYRMKDVIDQIQLKNGSKITFKSYDQGREKFQGAKIQWVHLDEEPPEDVYKEILMRLMDSKGHLWATMTPGLKGESFVYTIPELDMLPDDKRDPELYVAYMSWDDNPYLDDDEKKRMEQNMRPDEIEARKYGRFITAGQSPFLSVPLLRMRERLVREPERCAITWTDVNCVEVKTEATPEGEFMLWVKPDPEKEYIVSGDVAEGLEKGDYSTCGAWDRHTLELCCAWHGKNDADLFGDVLHRMAIFYNNAIEAPERNNHGLTTISAIKSYPNHNLYRPKPTGKMVELEGETYGWTTSWKTKPMLVDGLAKAIREESINVYWKRFYDECLSFVRQQRGNMVGYGARRGGYDDVVIMAGIALMVHMSTEQTADMPEPFKKYRSSKRKTSSDWDDEEEWGEEAWV